MRTDPSRTYSSCPLKLLSPTILPNASPRGCQDRPGHTYFLLHFVVTLSGNQDRLLVGSEKMRRFHARRIQIDPNRQARPPALARGQAETPGRRECSATLGQRIRP